MNSQAWAEPCASRSANGVIGVSQVFGDVFELGHGLPRLSRIALRRMGEAMVDVIVDQGLLGRRHGLLDCVKLLGEVEAGAAALDHGDGFPQMSLGAFEPIDDLGMGFMDDVGHSKMLSPRRG